MSPRSPVSGDSASRDDPSGTLSQAYGLGVEKHERAKAQGPGPAGAAGVPSSAQRDPLELRRQQSGRGAWTAGDHFPSRPAELLFVCLFVYWVGGDFARKLGAPLGLGDNSRAACERSRSCRTGRGPGGPSRRVPAAALVTSGVVPTASELPL